MDALLEALAEPVAGRVAELVPAREVNKEEAIAYTRLPRGTFEKLAADGASSATAPRTKIFNRSELDGALAAL